MFPNALRWAKLALISTLVIYAINVQPAKGRDLNVTLNRITRETSLMMYIPGCEIYCYGPLLKTIQMARLFEDSKTFVDMKLKLPAEKTFADFTALMKQTNDTPTNDELKQFVTDHFDDVGKEFEPWVADDWRPHPAFLDRILDPDLKQWGIDLNEVWRELGRKMVDDVHQNPQYYSIIPVEHPVIVPGGRFREFYYWDSYWIIRGLLYSEMFRTARGMLENFMSIVKRYGFIPNGGRIYYCGRSQPPLLAAMIKSYVEFTFDLKFGIEALEVMEHEYEYWINNHTVQAKGYNVCTYGGNLSTPDPRPESYREDVETVGTLAFNDKRGQQYKELKAAAESGMDFSSRWFITETGDNEGNLTNLQTRSIVPVELNAILYWNAKIIAEFHSAAGNGKKAEEYEEKAAKMLEAIEAVHWNKEVGAWLDYDLINDKPRNYFVPTNLAPLWTKAFNLNNSEQISKSVLAYIKKLELDKYPGGVPNTLYRSGEQWDYPNVWPPMQYLLIEGLKNLGTPASQQLSRKWIHRWVTSNFAAYSETRIMYEKYDAESFGGHGGGGEYDVQKGFGWSNGVIIEYLSKYGNELMLRSSTNARDFSPGDTTY